MLCVPLLCCAVLCSVGGPQHTFVTSPEHLIDRETAFMAMASEVLAQKLADSLLKENPMQLSDTLLCLRILP